MMEGKQNVGRKKEEAPRVPMNKKGLSAVIISLLLVALAIVITGILWAAISNLVNTGLGDLTLSGIQTEIRPTRTEYNPETQTWEITLNNVGKERQNVTVTGFKFVFHDERDSWDSVKKTEKLQPGTRKTYYVARSEMGSKQGIIKEIQIYPIVKENEKPERETASFKITPKKEVAFLPAREFLERLGAISWWRFENNVNNEFEERTSFSSTGNVKYGDGTFGKGLLDDASPTSPNLTINVSNELKNVLSNKDYSVSFFWKQQKNPPGGGSTTGPVFEMPPGLEFRIRDRTKTSIKFENVGYEIRKDARILISKQPRFSRLNFDEEYHVTLLCKRGEYVKFYVNGIKEGEKNGCETDPIKVSQMRFLNLKSNGTKLDEVVIFNRTLTDWEIKNVYGLDHST